MCYHLGGLEHIGESGMKKWKSRVEYSVNKA